MARRAKCPKRFQKATAAAKKAMIRVPLREGQDACTMMAVAISAPVNRAWSAPLLQGTGIIAGGPMRAVFESLGVADVVTKSTGTSNPYNMIRATFEALKRTDQSQVGGAASRQEDFADLLEVAVVLRRPRSPTPKPRL